VRIVDQPLRGITVGIPEARFAEALAKLFERTGARVESCPLVTEEILEDRSSIKSFIDRTIANGFDIVIFMTGIGVRLIFQEAHAIDKWEDFLSALSKTVVVSRGSKSTTALTQANVRIDIIPKSATSEGLIEVLQASNVAGRRIAIQLYGTPNPVLTSALQRSGAEVLPVPVYSYTTASAASDVEAFIRKLFSGEIQIIVFTSAPQVHALFQAAENLKTSSNREHREAGAVGSLPKLGGETRAARRRGSETLARILADGVQVASIGAVTTRALQAYGIHPQIVPDQPKLGALVQAICTTRSF
jgi:uroporphyrinogen-III synthase